MWETTAEVARTSPAQDWPCPKRAMGDGGAHEALPFSTKLLDTNEFWEVVVKGVIISRYVPTGEHQAPKDSSRSLATQISLIKCSGSQNETKILMSERYFIEDEGLSGLGGSKSALNTLYNV